MNGKGRTRQLHAWSFAAATVPAVMTCAGIAWPWVLAGCAAAAVFYFLLGLLRDETKRPETFRDLKSLQAKVREVCTHTL